MNTEIRVPGQKEVGDEPLPGYRLIEPLGSGGFGEVWKCEAPGGLLKAIKFVKGSSAALDGDSGRNSALVEFQAIQRVKAVRHPFMLRLASPICRLRLGGLLGGLLTSASAGRGTL